MPDYLGPPCPTFELPITDRDLDEALLRDLPWDPDRPLKDELPVAMVKRPRLQRRKRED